MAKKIISFTALVAILIAFVFLTGRIKQEENKMVRNTEILTEKTYQIRKQIQKLEEEIEKYERQAEVGTMEPTVIYGFYATSPETIMPEGTIILDSNASAELLAAARNTQRDYLYLSCRNSNASGRCGYPYCANG